MTDKRLAIVFFQLTIKEKAAKNKPANSFVVLFIYFFLIACMPAWAWLCVICMCLSMCVLFLFVPALLMDCHPGLSRKAASSVGLGINPGIMALMPSWVEAKLFKKYWLPESLSPLFLSPPLSSFSLHRSSLGVSVILCSSSFFSLFFSGLYLFHSHLSSSTFFSLCLPFDSSPCSVFT